MQALIELSTPRRTHVGRTADQRNVLAGAIGFLAAVALLLAMLPTMAGAASGPAAEPQPMPQPAGAVSQTVAHA